MNIWLMQIHPDDTSKAENWAIKALKNYFIALDLDYNLDPTNGKSFDEWSDEDFEYCRLLHKKEIKREGVSRSIKNFYHTMQQGDLVLVKAGQKPLALAQVKNYFFEPYPTKDIEFRHRRKVDILSWYETFKQRFPNFELNLPAPGTLMRLDDVKKFNYKTIMSWYKHIKKETYMNKLHRLLNLQKQIILTGPPGTGKTYTAKQLALSMLQDNSYLDDPNEQFEKINNEQAQLIQFHPAYNYEDFVRGIQISTNQQGALKYWTVNKTLGDMAEKAKFKNHPSILIIDEINRANLAAVIGELIYALEYRDNPVQTPYAPEGQTYELAIPSNLYIIGTMNTADRSVGHIDYAVRRRFAFVPCLPDRSVLESYYADSNNSYLKDTALRLFDSVAELFGETGTEDNQNKQGYLAPDFFKDDVQVGHTYFMANDCKELAVKFAYQVYPLLREYYKDGILVPENEKEIEIKIDQEHTGDRLLRLNKPEEGHKIFDKVVRKCEEREQLDSGDPMQSEEDNQDFQDTMNQEPKLSGSRP